VSEAPLPEDFSSDAPHESDADRAAGAGPESPDVRGATSDRERQSAIDAARAAHAPRSTMSGRAATLSYAIIAGAIAVVMIGGYLIAGVNGLIFGLVMSLVILAVGGIPIWFAQRSQEKERRRYAAEARARAQKRVEREGAGSGPKND